MANADSNVIAFPPDLIAAAQRHAEETQMFVSQVAEEALRFYVDSDPELNALRNEHRQRAAALDLTPDEYVMRLVKESRTEKRLKSA